MTNAVETRDLVRVFEAKHKRGEKREGPVTALDRIELEINEGELFGVLGPNGAGKTTLIKIFCTLLLPTSGKAYVGGFDVEKDAYEIRRIISMVSGGETSGYGILTVRENLWLFSQLHGMKKKEALRRIDELLEVVGLTDKAHTRMNKISTGMRQKMNVIRGFINDPEILFLDEPTLGLDVQASRTVRNYIKNWMRENKEKTILLTTHYMQEADEMCDRLAIVDNGKVLACDTPANLKKMVKQESVFRLKVNKLAGAGGPKGFAERFNALKGVRRFTYRRAEDGTASLRFIIDEEGVVSDIVSEIINADSKILSLTKTEPTLEDVFINLVGRGLTNGEAGETNVDIIGGRRR